MQERKLAIEVEMHDVEVVYPLTRETDLLALLLDVEDQRKEAFDVCTTKVHRLCTSAGSVVFPSSESKDRDERDHRDDAFFRYVSPCSKQQCMSDKRTLRIH